MIEAWQASKGKGVSDRASEARGGVRAKERRERGSRVRNEEGE